VLVQTSNGPLICSLSDERETTINTQPAVAYGGTVISWVIAFANVHVIKGYSMPEMLVLLCPVVAMIVGRKADSDDKAELRPK
jgi:hypothetical protein